MFDELCLPFNDNGNGSGRVLMGIGPKHKCCGKNENIIN